MPTTRKIAHNTLLQLGGKIVSTLLGLIALGLMTRMLGTERFGWYTSAISFLQFIGILIDFGLTPVTAQMIGEGAIEKNTLLNNLLGFRLTTAVIVFGLGPLVASLLHYPTQIVLAMWLLAISFIATAVNQVLIGRSQADLNMKLAVGSELIGRVVLVVGMWLLVLYGAPFLPFIAVITMAGLVSTISLWIASTRHNRLRPAFDWSIWRIIWQKSWPISLSIVFNVIYLRGDILILQHYVDQSQIGLYGAAYRVLDVIAQAGMMLMGIFLPLLAFTWSSRNAKKFHAYYQQAFDTMMILAAPLTVGGILLATPIIQLIAGNNFTASGRILQILSLAILGIFLGAVFGHVAVAINKQKQTMIIYITDAIFTLIGYIYIIPRYGAIGAAWLSVFSEVYAGIGLAWVITHTLEHPLQFKTFRAIVFACALMGITLVFLPPLPILLSTVIGGTVYVAFLVLSGTIKKSTIKEIFSLKPVLENNE